MTGDSPMTRGRRADSARRRQRVIKAINEASASGGELSVSAIARAAGVDRTFLYRHPDLLAQAHLAQERPDAAENGGPAASRASLQADLANAQGQVARQAARVRQLEAKLSQMLGEQAWRESGLGAPERQAQAADHRVGTGECRSHPPPGGARRGTRRRPGRQPRDDGPPQHQAPQRIPSGEGTVTVRPPAAGTPA